MQTRHRNAVPGTPRSERGSETMEFALVAPIFLLLAFGLIYVLLLLAAFVNLSHATNNAARYAAIPVHVEAESDGLLDEDGDALDPITGETRELTTYPTQDMVAERLFDGTPFFSADGCTLLLDGDERENAPVTIEVDCAFPNPLGAALNGLTALWGGDGTLMSEQTPMKATAQARRE